MFAVKDGSGQQMNLDGVLNLTKPSGWTSHDVVAKLRRVLKGIRVGHAGTLDPAATGVLPILLGKGTRIAEYLLTWDKEYRAVLRLGQTTDTLDATGTVLKECEINHLTPETIRIACAAFQGDISQIPPMYSAVKVQGVPLYKSARAGKIVERQSRLVTVHDLNVLQVDGADVTLQVRCSKGTYIRTLCADIGSKLKVGGYLLSLERQRVGPLALEESYTLEEAIECFHVDHVVPCVLSLDEALGHLPVVIVSDVAAERARHGVAVPFHAVQWDRSSREVLSSDRCMVRLKGTNQQLVGIGAVQRDAMIEDRSVAVVKVLSERSKTIVTVH